MDEEGFLLKCPKCDTNNAEGTKYCQGCGSKIRWMFAERKCTHCGNKWSPRTSSPRTCPNCGYRLSRDSEVEIHVPVRIIDEGSAGMLETKCSVCGKETRKYALFKSNSKEKNKDVCYVCLIEYFKEREKGEDIVEGSFRTVSMEKNDKGTMVLKKEESTIRGGS